MIGYVIASIQGEMIMDGKMIVGSISPFRY
jgi:hypothetical protein